MSRLISKTVVYEGWSTLYKATLQLGSGAVVTREVEHHGSAVAVPPFDPDRRVALLIRQLRTGPLVDEAAEAHMLEAPAGLIDPGEGEEAAVRREAFEEVGASLGELDLVGSSYPMPAVSTERIACYLATYSAGDPRGPAAVWMRRTRKSKWWRWGWPTSRVFRRRMPSRT
jgi:8-oxo-dGTP pyrophosphatase MutT (NUDIX family)